MKKLGFASVLLLIGFALPLAQSPAPAGPTGQQPQQPTQPQQPAPAGPPPAGQQPQQPPGQPADQAQRPVIRRGVNYVSVDVIVTDNKGNPVLDLKPEDFEVSEEGKPQKVESFQVVKVAQEQGDQIPSPIRTQADLEREAERADVRIFAFLLDDYHVRRGSSLGVRDPLMRFVQQHVAPTDLVGIMYPLTPVTDFQLSRNRDALASAFKGFMGRKFEYEPRNSFEERYAYYPAETVEQIRNQVTLSALRALVTHLGGLREGRKAVILVSEGFSNTLPAQLADPVAALPGYGNPNRRRGGAVDDTTTGQTSREFFAQADLMTELRYVYAAANRANTAIYALDPRGLAPFEFDINEGVGGNADRTAAQTTRDTLFTLAAETDGRAIVNRNDLDGGLRQIVRDSSAYYLLGYNSTQSPTDGKFHEIKVRIKRPGVQVRARKGYWAYSPEDAARATASAAAAASGTPAVAPEIDRALSSLAVPRSRPVRTWVGTSKGEDGRTRVTVSWEPAPAGPGAISAARPAQIALTVLGPSGQPFFRGTIAERKSAQFDVPAGALQIRYNIETAEGRLIDSDTRELNVPDYSAAQVQLSTPTVFRGRTVRDLQAVRADPSSAPTASREFTRAERLILRVSAYAPGGQAPSVTARLLNRTGKAMSDLPVKGPDALIGSSYETELPLSALAAGEYLVEFKVAAPGGGEAKALLAFRVTS